ncbi:MAG: M14 family metallopeptidase [Phycisphaerales bacterium]
MSKFRHTLIGGAIAGASLATTPVIAQPHIEGKVEIAFNRYHTPEEIQKDFRDIAAAYPDLVTLKTIGKSGEERDMFLAVLNNPKTGAPEDKPAMWIDGGIHANEIQGSEVVLYTLWYLTKAYGVNDDLTTLMDTYAFYLLPMVNPDSRAAFFEDPSTPHYPRWNQRPVDNDRDGLVDEDPPDDLDGDGSITQMWVRDPDGRWERDTHDPRIFRRVKDDQKGEWTYLGQEGIDNDGDGRINEDGPGGDDMNRNWPGDWKPNYIQYGAGTYPLSDPEVKCIATWIMEHPNIAAFQSFHNAAGMILRGPGASYMQDRYPRADQRVYEEIGKLGEELLPYYSYLVVYSALYDVHGGEVDWTAESLGIISFTNEIWNEGKYFQRDGADPSDERMWTFRDKLQFGQTFTDYTEVDHPQYGKVLVGGLNKWSSRSTPTFMLEEECHRNFAFTMVHASQMPRVAFGRVEVERVGPRLWSVTAEVRNEMLIPTRTAVAAQRGIGVNDLLELSGASVVASGSLEDWRDKTIDETRFEPARVQLPRGVPGRGSVIQRFYVEGGEGEEITLRYSGQKAGSLERRVKLSETRAGE